MLKDFIVRKTLEHKLKNFPAAQREALIKMVGEHPDFFKKIDEEIKQKKKDTGMNDETAALFVMQKYKSEMQKMFNS